MKTEILEIITQHKYDHISSEQAISELLDLFGVVGQSEQFFAFLDWYYKPDTSKLLLKEYESWLKYKGK